MFNQHSLLLANGRIDFSSINTSSRSWKQKACIASVLGHQLRRHDPTLTLSEAMWYAYDEIKKFGDQYLLLKSYTIDKTGKRKYYMRVVMKSEISKYYKVKGTGRPSNPGQHLFVDAARLHTGQKSFIISTYRIVDLF